MQTLLNDIELDIQELKCLMQAIAADANPALRTVAKRNIRQMEARLDTLLHMLDDEPALSVQAGEPHVQAGESRVQAAAQVRQEPPAAEVHEPSPSLSSPASSILAERIRPTANLRQAISLNDSFRFTKELFNGDAARMNETVRRLGEAPSLDDAMAILASEVQCPDEGNEAFSDLTELLRKYFS